jgi:hypothetical protein
VELDFQIDVLRVAAVDVEQAEQLGLLLGNQAPELDGVRLPARRAHDGAVLDARRGSERFARLDGSKPGSDLASAVRAKGVFFAETHEAESEQAW